MFIIDLIELILKLYPDPETLNQTVPRGFLSPKYGLRKISVLGISIWTGCYPARIMVIRSCKI